MFKLDNALLEELGLGSLPPAEKNRILAHIYETLEMRVGMKLAEQMSNEQLDEFEGYIDKNDEAGALKWLETNFPNYKQVVADQLEQLKAEVKQAAPQIVASSQQNAAANPPAPVQPEVPPTYQQPQPQAAPAWQPPVGPTPMTSPAPGPPPSQFPPQPSPSSMPPAEPFPVQPAQPPAAPLQPPAASGMPPYQQPTQPPFQPMPPQWQPPASGTPPPNQPNDNQQPPFPA